MSRGSLALEQYRSRHIKLDELVTAWYQLDQIDLAIEALKNGKALLYVIFKHNIDRRNKNPGKMQVLFKKNKPKMDGFSPTRRLNK